MLNFAHVLQDWLHPRVWVSGSPPGLLQPAARGVGQRPLSRISRVHPPHQAHTERDWACPMALIATFTVCYSEKKILFQCCGSRMFIPDSQSWFYPSRIPGIPDPTTVPKEKGVKICCPTIFCSHKYHKIGNDFIFDQVKKNFFSQSNKNYSTF